MRKRNKKGRKVGKKEGILLKEERSEGGKEGKRKRKREEVKIKK